MKFEATTIFGNLEVDIYQPKDSPYTYIDAYITTPLGDVYSIEMTKNCDLKDIGRTEKDISIYVAQILDIYVEKLTEDRIDYKMYTMIS